MKGKSTFTRSEANAIIALIRQKLQAGAQEQKSIRDKIRKIGFYASDFGIGGGYDEHDFLKAVSIAGEMQVSLPKPKAITPSSPTIKQGKVEGLAPVSDATSSVLILGTMPGAESLRRQEYYGNPRNMFWKLVGVVTGEPAPATYEEKKRYLLRHGIALWDMCAVCVRPGSLDSAITDEVPNDIRGFVAAHPQLKVIGCNGGKAAGLYKKYVGSIAGVEMVELPSGSPANAGISWEVKVERWGKMSGL